MYLYKFITLLFPQVTILHLQGQSSTSPTASNPVSVGITAVSPAPASTAPPVAQGVAVYEQTQSRNVPSRANFSPGYQVHCTIIDNCSFAFVFYIPSLISPVSLLLYPIATTALISSSMLTVPQTITLLTFQGNEMSRMSPGKLAQKYPPLPQLPRQSRQQGSRTQVRHLMKFTVFLVLAILLALDGKSRTLLS